MSRVQICQLGRWDARSDVDRLAWRFCRDKERNSVHPRGKEGTDGFIRLGIRYHVSNSCESLLSELHGTAWTGFWINYCLHILCHNCPTWTRTTPSSFSWTYIFLCLRYIGGPLLNKNLSSVGPQERHAALPFVTTKIRDTVKEQNCDNLNV